MWRQQLQRTLSNALSHFLAFFVCWRCHRIIVIRRDAKRQKLIWKWLHAACTQNMWYSSSHRRHTHTAEHYNNQTSPCSSPDIGYIITCAMYLYIVQVSFHCACYRNSEMNFFCFLLSTLCALQFHFEIYLCLLFASTIARVRGSGILLALSKIVRFIHQQNALRSFQWIVDFSTTEISNVRILLVAQLVVMWVGWLRWSVRKLSFPMSFSWALWANKHFFCLRISHSCCRCNAILMHFRSSTDRQ